MFALAKPKSKKDVDDQYIKVSSLINSDSVLDRRKKSDERRLLAERRKSFSILCAENNKREIKLAQRRKYIDRRDFHNKSVLKTNSLNNLELNAVSINSLIKDQMLIANKISKLLPFKKEAKLSQVDTIIRMIYTDIKSLMEKEEYLLCLYLKKNAGKLSKENINKLLSIINTDISQLSDDMIQIVDKLHKEKCTEANIGFIQLDIISIREKTIICLYKKKKHLYQIYIT